MGEWVEAEAALGAAALAAKKRGRKPGEQKALTFEQERQNRRLIADKCPIN